MIDELYKVLSNMQVSDPGRSALVKAISIIKSKDEEIKLLKSQVEATKRWNKIQFKTSTDIVDYCDDKY